MLHRDSSGEFHCVGAVNKTGAVSSSGAKMGEVVLDSGGKEYGDAVPAGTPVNETELCRFHDPDAKALLGSPGPSFFTLS